ncbi:MAG TPA: protein kinase [Steroidobacteraceae bacterium]|jgi:tRNA A-37 threonylcarbamoyl transferase component Bud32/DNA-binding response OmpR family regulator|nr:protein kinase [Steroidobacteraceae bacterium]
MDAARIQRFLIVENDAKYAHWLQHAVGAGWPNDSIVIMDWTSFGRVRTAMTVRDYDIVLLSLAFDEGIEEPTTDSFDWIRKLRSQPGFPEMIILGEGGSELAAIRTLRLGAADYLPKRLLTPPRLQRSIKLTLRAIEKEAQRRAERQAQAAGKPDIDKHAVSLTGSVKITPAAPSHISTQTGASIARAAAQVIAPPTPAASALAPVPAPAPARPHIATHTGASLALAAKAALAAHAPAVAVAATPKEPKPVAPENHQIPGYAILQKIGESEAAAVYLAIAEDLGHNVALKISKRKHSGADPNDTGQRQIMFQREFEAIAALDHPSIIDLFDYGIHEGVEYLAMEYFPCGDLKARLQNPLTADEAIDFLKEIARSLKVVHEAGIIHRDLKPPNVMLRDDGSVVLIDFGLARSLLSGDGSTRTGVLRGSPYYMSPEQAQGEALDARTDIYSLGVILYEMLAGKKPYLGASAIDVLQQHVMAPVPELPVHQLAYQPLLERLMSKSREQRIPSCEELLSALEQMRLSHDSGIIDPETLISAGAAP